MWDTKTVLTIDQHNTLLVIMGVAATAKDVSIALDEIARVLSIRMLSSAGAEPHLLAEGLLGNHS